MNAIAQKDPGLKNTCELIKEGIKEISVPPLMAFKVSTKTFNEIEEFTNILEERRLIWFRYYKIKPPCVFYLDSKDKITSDNIIKVNRFGKEVIRL